MKKCHLCGTSQDKLERTLQESDGKLYCGLCLIQRRNPNKVRRSILKFWREREGEEVVHQKVAS